MSAIVDIAAPTASSRACHWVLKVGNLKTSMCFFEDVLGMRVLRHEEFETGCEATCNGPYAGAWSKTMVGYGPEDSNFALELTYNYGIDGYESGNDLLFIALQMDVADTKKRAEEAGFAVAVEGESVLITGPDKRRYKVVPPQPDRQERFHVVALNVASLPASLRYWSGVLGLTEEAPSAGLVPPSAAAAATVGFGGGHSGETECVSLLLIQTDGAAVEHKLAGGRIAFACKAVPPIYEAVKAAEGTVLTPPLTLPTPGKADVVVTILADPDGYEICFVEDEAFYQLATPTYDVIDWAARAARGGDGAPPPSAAKRQHSADAGIVAAETQEDLDGCVALAGPERYVLLDFGAGWCKNCKRILPAVEELAKEQSERLVVAAVDIDTAEELVDAFSVSKLPFFVLLREGKKVAEYLGSSADELRAALTAAMPPPPA